MNARELFDKAEKLRNEEKLDEAMKSYMQASKLADEEKDHWVMAESIHMIGLIHLQRKEYIEATHCLESAKMLFQKQKDDDMVGSVLRDLAQVKVEENNLAEAEKYLQHSIRYLEKGNRLGHLGISKVRLGSLYGKKKEFDKAESLIKEGISDIESSDDKFFESSAYYSLARLYKEQDKKEEAITTAEISLQILKIIAPDGLHEVRKKELLDFIEELNRN